jgi:hypothetical protein
MRLSFLIFFITFSLFTFLNGIGMASTHFILTQAWWAPTIPSWTSAIKKIRSKPKHWISKRKPSTLFLQRWFSMRTYLKDLSFLFLSLFALFNQVNDRTYQIWLIRINLHDFQSWDLSIMNWGRWSFLFEL